MPCQGCYISFYIFLFDRIVIILTNIAIAMFFTINENDQ